jgi:hypothetical protein
MELQLIGTWILTSGEHMLPNGSKVQSYGTNPKGIVVFDANGLNLSLETLPRNMATSAECEAGRAEVLLMSGSAKMRYKRGRHGCARLSTHVASADDSGNGVP